MEVLGVCGKDLVMMQSVTDTKSSADGRINIHKDTNIQATKDGELTTASLLKSVDCLLRVRESSEGIPPPYTHKAHRKHKERLSTTEAI